MPDMAEMNSDQKRRFRIGILTLMQDILSEKTSASTISTVLPNIVGNQQPHYTDLTHNNWQQCRQEQCPY